jgi:hypothetical protein
MADESRSEERPDALAAPADIAAASPAPLRREVEAPRTGAGLWLPFMALASAAMLTITSGIAVMTRPPRAHVMIDERELPAAKPLTPEQMRQLELETTQLERDVDATTRADQIKAQQAEAQSRMERYRVMCRAPVHRGDLDSDDQPYDECIVPPEVAAKASTGPEVR